MTKKDFDEFVDKLFAEPEEPHRTYTILNGVDLKKIRELRGDKVLYNILNKVGIVTNDEGIYFIELFLQEMGGSIDDFDVIKQERFIEPHENGPGGILKFIEENNPDD